MRILILILILAVTGVSCKKTKQNKLVGNWEQLPQFASDTVRREVYTFNASNKLYRSSSIDSIDTADYVISMELTKYYLNITNLDKYDDGNYYIEELDKDILILQSYSPFLRKEFTRIK